MTLMDTKRWEPPVDIGARLLNVGRRAVHMMDPERVTFFAGLTDAEIRAALDGAERSVCALRYRRRARPR